MKAAIYARVSTAEQVEGHSIDEQVLALQSHCESRDWQLVSTYVDAGYSGSTGQRPYLQDLLTDADNGAFDVVVVHAIDRFYRNLQGLLGALDRLNKAGVTFVSLKEQMDFTTPWGKLTLAVIGSLAEIFLDKLSAEVSKGKLGRARKGLSNAPIPAYGYKRMDGMDVPLEEERIIVNWIYERYNQGDWSFQKIATALNQMNVAPSPRNRTGKWTWKSVDSILANPFYIGQVQYRDKFYPGQHEPIVNEGIWQLAQVVRRKRTTHRVYSGRTGRIYLLQGLVWCIWCGHKLHVHSSPPYNYYHHRHTGECEEYDGSHLPMHFHDDAVARLVERLRLPEDWRGRLAELLEHDDIREEVQQKRKAIEGRIRRLKDLYVDGDLTREDYTRKRDSLQAQLAGLKEPEPLAVEQAAEVLLGLGAAWQNADEETRQQIVRTLFAAVYVDGEEVICVRPHKEFVPLLRLDGMEEKNGHFYIEETTTES